MQKTTGFGAVASNQWLDLNQQHSGYDLEGHRKSADNPALSSDRV
jgi:hypothetical protein